MKNNLFVLLVVSTFVSTTVFAAKGYQVTGPVTAVSPTSITVMKGKESWELAKSATTKGAADVKVGDKVTVYYSMTAEEVEVKADKKKK